MFELIFPLALALAQPATPVTADWVAKKMDERDTGKDGRMEMEMKLYDRRGRETVRRLTLLSRRDNGIDRVLLRFSFPGDIRDTAFLAIENPAGEDDRFLFLPSLGRSRRISAQEKQESFVGSDLTYEDISGRKLDDYTYRLAGDESIDSAPCYVLESKAKDASAKYPRALSWIDKESFVIRKGDVFDRSGEKAKAYRAQDVARIDGIWTVKQMTMENLKQGTSTVLTSTRIEYNRGIPESTFTRKSLEQPGR